MLICAPDGHILQVVGPLYADGKNNDEGIFKAMTTPESEVFDSGFGTYFEEGDIVVWDRGFRFVNNGPKQWDWK